MPEARKSKLLLPELTEPVVPAAIEVHKQLGPGLLEHAYQDAIAHEFRLSKPSSSKRDLELFIKRNYFGVCFGRILS